MAELAYTIERENHILEFYPNFIPYIVKFKSKLIDYSNTHDKEFVSYLMSTYRDYTDLRFIETVDINKLYLSKKKIDIYICFRDFIKKYLDEYDVHINEIYSEFYTLKIYTRVIV